MPKPIENSRGPGGGSGRGRSVQTLPAIHDWDRVAAMPDFKAMIAAKTRLIVAACIFFVIYYFSLPVLVGYAPEFMETRVIGSVNIAYLFALSQFFMAWILAIIYVKIAARFDEQSKAIIERLDDQPGERG